VGDLLLVLINIRNSGFLTYGPAVEGQVGVAIWLVSSGVGDGSGCACSPALAACEFPLVGYNVCR
jgi:hypothetical protein